MDLKEIKRLTAYARKAGIKRLKFGEIELELHDAAIFPQAGKPKAVPDDGIPKAPPIPEPTIDQINDYIYRNVDEAG